MCRYFGGGTGWQSGSYVIYEYDANGNITNTEVCDAQAKEKDDAGGGGSPEDNPQEEPAGGIAALWSAVVKVVKTVISWVKSLFRFWR